MERQTTTRYYESFDDMESVICAHRVQFSVQRRNVVEAVNTLCFMYKGAAKNKPLKVALLQ
jgi:hypothetical protein